MSSPDRYGVLSSKDDSSRSKMTPLYGTHSSNIGWLKDTDEEERLPTKKETKERSRLRKAEAGKANSSVKLDSESDSSEGIEEYNEGVAEDSYQADRGSDSDNMERTGELEGRDRKKKWRFIASLDTRLLRDAQAFDYLG